MSGGVFLGFFLCVCACMSAVQANLNLDKCGEFLDTAN